MSRIHRHAKKIDCPPVFSAIISSFVNPSSKYEGGRPRSDRPSRLGEVWVCFLLLGISLLVACQALPPVVVEPIEREPGLAIFSKAVQFDNFADHDTALNYYHRYMLEFPDGPRAGDALFRTGKIYQTQRRHAEARNTYRRLVARFPGSPHVEEASVEVLVTLFEEARYEEVLAGAEEVLKRAVSRRMQVVIKRLSGDAHSAMGELENAVKLYKSAYGIADVEARASLTGKFQEVLAQLDSPALTRLLDETIEKELNSYILFQLAQNRIDTDESAAAEERLEALLRQSPDHEKAGAATRLLSELREKAAYDPNAVGCLLPLTGRYQAYGNRALKGIELALRQFAQESGISTIRLLVSDTSSDPIKTVQAVQRMAEQKVAAIIGPMISAQAAAVEAQERRIPLIALSQKENITSAGDYIFRNFITPKLQVKALVSFAVQTLGATRFAILYPDDKYGNTFMNLFWDEVIAAKGRVVGVESYPAGLTDFADPIRKLTGIFYNIPEALKIQRRPPGAGPAEKQEVRSERGAAGEAEHAEGQGSKANVDFDMIFIPDDPNTAGLIVPQLAFHDVKNVHLMGTNLWHSQKLIQMARRYVQNAIFSSGFNVYGRSKKVNAFVQGFWETFGEKPGFIEAVAFDTTMLLLEQMTRPDVQHRSRLKDALTSLKDFDGLTGRTSFDPSGEAQKSLLLFRIEKDRIIEIPKEHQKP